MFTPATRSKLKARIALVGPAGSGKTYTGLRWAFQLAGPGGRVAVLDTEHGAASKYEGEQPDGVPWHFDTCQLARFSPSDYQRAIEAAGQAGYDVLVIDSLSHSWDGADGTLEQVDRKGKGFAGWKDITPVFRRMIEAILAVPCHVIVTMRSKVEYVVETNAKGKAEPRKVGTAPVMRQGIEFEFDLCADLDLSHQLTISKTRCPALDEASVIRPDAAFLTPYTAWLGQGADAPHPAQPQPSAPAEPSGNGDTAPAQPVEPKANTGQLDAIQTLLRKLKIPSADTKRALAKRDVERLDQLTVGQAGDMIQNLNNIQRERATTPA